MISVSFYQDCFWKVIGYPVPSFDSGRKWFDTRQGAASPPFSYILSMVSVCCSATWLCSTTAVLVSLRGPPAHHYRMLTLASCVLFVILGGPPWACRGAYDSDGWLPLREATHGSALA